MTKEEAIENIKLIRFNAAITNANSFKEALDIAIEALSQPSLPSNLDEAALKELQVYLPQGNGPDGICYFIAPQMLAMYKAGAELMAGQSQKIDGDLEKEAEAYWKAQGGGSHAQWDKFRAVVKHFTNWQKEQILKDAVEGFVSYINSDHEAVIYQNNTGVTMPSYFKKEGLQDGDKVKLIIIKEDEKH